jgi:hypothetical protein
MRRRGRWAAGLVVVGLVTTGAVAAAAPAARPTPADRALIRAGLVTRADVPASWTGSRQSNDLAPFAKLASCRTVYATLLAANRRVPNALSRQFTDPASHDQTVASDQVFAFPTVQAASTYLAAFNGPTAGACLQAAVQAAVLGVGVNNTAGTGGAVAGLAGVGDETAGQQVTLSASASGTSVTLVVDFAAVRVGRTVLAFDFLNADHPLPQGLAIINAAVTRVQHTG